MFQLQYFYFVNLFDSFILLLMLCLHPQIDAAKPVEEVFESVKAFFTSKNEKVKHHRCALWKFNQLGLCFGRKLKSGKRVY
jgi:hypothetical protein